MHNNIMAAGSRDRPPMLATGRYAQSLHTFYVIIPAIPATDYSPKVLEQTTVETLLNMSPENKELYQLEKEAIHLLLTGFGDKIYSTVNACKTAHDMWIAIKRLQQGESLNIQDECKKQKRVKDYTYHKEKMLLCKQIKKGVPLQAEQSDWLEDTDKEIDEQESEAHYSYMAKIQEHSEQPKSINNTCIVEKVDSNVIPDLPDMFVKEKQDELVKQSFLTKSRYEGLVKQKTKVIMDLKLKEEKDLDKLIAVEKQLKFLNEIVYKRNQSIQTIHMIAPKGSTFSGRPTFENLMYLKKAQSEKRCLYEIPYDTSNPANRFVPNREETLTLEKESRPKSSKDLGKPYDYTKQNSLYENFKPAS
nr:hypothetical protein [Tanacetum cinerariifolium]